jgi:hypothetical protein
MKPDLTIYTPCEDALMYYNTKDSFEQAWNDCQRGDWMLWIYQRMLPDNDRLLVLTEGHCVNTVRHLMKDERSTKAVDAAIAYGEGKITKQELEDARPAARAAARAATRAAESKKENQRQTADICRKYLTETILNHVKK